MASGLGEMGASPNFHCGLEPDPVTSGCRRMIQADSERLPEGDGSSKRGGSLSSNPPHSSLVSSSFSFPFPLSHFSFPFLAYFWLGLFLSRRKSSADISRFPYPSDPVTVSTERISLFLNDGLLKGLSLALQIPLEIITSNYQVSIMTLVGGCQCLGPWEVRLYPLNLIEKSKESNGVRRLYVCVVCSFAMFDNP